MANVIIKRFQEVVDELGYDTSITLQLGHYFNDSKERVPYEEGMCGLTVFHRGMIYTYIVPIDDLGFNTIKEHIVGYVQTHYNEDIKRNAELLSE